MMKIESVEVILMNKDSESMFGEPYIEDEFSGVTYDFDEWKEFYDNRTRDIYDRCIKIDANDEDVWAFVKSARGYMTAPVGKLGFEIIEARTVVVHSLEDVRFDVTNSYIYDILKTKLVSGEIVIKIRFAPAP
jgi:hypothetical protein